MKNSITVLLLMAVFAVSCEDNDAIVVIDQPKSLCNSIDILYSNDIAPLLGDAGCSGSYCHGNGAGGYTMTDYSTTKTAAEDPKFLKAIRHEQGTSPMPKNGTKLSDTDIQKIECWIQSGFKE